MVQRQNPLQQGDFYQGENWSRNNRPSAFLDIPQDNRFVPAQPTTPVHARTQTIEDALKECVGIPVKAYALVVRLENGEDKFYSSASLTEYRERIFTEPFKQNFRRSVRRATNYPHSAFSQDGTMFGEFDADASSSGGYNRKHSSSGGSSSDAKKRRYPNYRNNRDESNDDTPVPIPIRKTQQLRIGDEAEVEQFYQTRFKDMQQSSCKIMGKAFVKLVEPKKQTHHPYTKGDEKAPPWWPNTAGDKGVRHREPDHLLKPERIRLLVHILRMVTEPVQQQHPTIQKLDLNVAKLEEVTMEAMNNWFNDKEHLENAQKKPFLKEIFKIARAEERYKNGEIDGSTYFSVMHGERAGTDESDCESDMKPEGDEEEIPSSAVPASISSPESMISATAGNYPHLLENDARVRLPVRQGTHPPMEEQTPQYTDNSGFYNPRTIGFNPQSPTVHDRRPYVATTNYPSPQSNMYTNWSMVSNGPGQAFYTTSPQQNIPPSTVPFLPPINPQQTMLPPPQLSSNYENLAGPTRYDNGPALGNNSLRTGSMSHPHPHPQHAPTFDFMHDHGGFGGQHEEGLKDDGQKYMHSNQ